MQERIDALLARSRVSIGRAVGEWFTDDSTLNELLRDRLAPTFNQFWREAASSGKHVLGRQRTGFDESAAVREALRQDLRLAHIDIAQIGSGVVGGQQPAKHGDAPEPSLNPDDLPMQPRLRDRLLLRSPAKLRKRLFGTADAPAASIPSDGKNRWLGEPARQVMAQGVSDQLDELAERAAQDFLPGAIAAYLEALQRDLHAQLGQERLRLQDERSRNAAELETVKAALQRLDALSAVRNSSAKSLATLSARFAGAAS